MSPTRIAITVLAAAFCSSCATLKVNRPEVARVKRLAIVGYVGNLKLDEGQSSGIAAMVGAVKGNIDLFSGKLGERRTSQATEDYAELSKVLGDALHWEVLDKATLVQSPQYAPIGKKSGGLFMQEKQYVPGIAAPYQLPSQEKALQQLASSLGVDAVAVVDLRYEVERATGISVAGLGNRVTYPAATLHFQVFNSKGALIWEDWTARGPATKEGLRNTVGANIVSNETRVLHEAAMGAFRALITRFRSAKS